MYSGTSSPQIDEHTGPYVLVERVGSIISRVGGAKPDYARLAAELEPAIPFDVFGIVLLRHDREAVRITVCTRRADGWVAHYHQHPLKESMVERILQRQETRAALDGARSGLYEETNSPATASQASITGK